MWHRPSSDKTDIDSNDTAMHWFILYDNIINFMLIKYICANFSRSITKIDNKIHASRAVSQG
jgi:hypothetical protein